eukprot:6086599-Prymnesium_polylepis.1
MLDSTRTEGRVLCACSEVVCGSRDGRESRVGVEHAQGGRRTVGVCKRFRRGPIAEAALRLRLCNRAARNVGLVVHDPLRDAGAGAPSACHQRPKLHDAAVVVVRQEHLRTDRGGMHHPPLEVVLEIRAAVFRIRGKR